MCMDCGCGMAHDDMGEPEVHITYERLKKAAEANEQGIRVYTVLLGMQGKVVVPQIDGADLPHVITGTMLHKMMYGEMPRDGSEKIPAWIKVGLGLGGNESYPQVFAPFGGFADDFEVALALQQSPHSLAEQRVVVGQQDADRHRPRSERRGTQTVTTAPRRPATVMPPP